MRVFGIDCGTEFTGYGVVEVDCDARMPRLVHLAAGTIRLSKKDKAPQRLAQIYAELTALLALHQPEVVAIEEVESKEGSITIFAPPAEFYKAKKALLEAFPGLELEIQEIRFLPQTSKTLSGEDLGLFEKLLGMLNDCDDVQEIYHNIALT